MAPLSALCLALVLPASAEPAEPAAEEPVAIEAPAEPAPDRAPLAEEVDARIHRALSVRHPVPSCAEIEALSSTPVESLLRMVERVSQPPWVPMRAAECLLKRHHTAIRPQLERWVVAPELRGLGLLVLGQLDALPPELARELVVLALAQGPDPEGTRARLRRHADPELRALAEDAP